MAVITEAAFIPLYQDQPLLDEQMRILRGHGFVLHKFIDPVAVPLRGRFQARIGVDSLRNQLVDADAVFIRPIPPDTELETGPLSHLAMLAASVFDSLDVTLRCLEILVERDAVGAQAAEEWVASLTS